MSSELDDALAPVDGFIESAKRVAMDIHPEFTDNPSFAGEQFHHRKFDGIPRTTDLVVVTEKIDGTNGLVIVAPDRSWVAAGSRNTLLSLKDDNFAFAHWVNHHRDQLATVLGPGYHYGEWYGVGIQRAYGLWERRFMLFPGGRKYEGPLFPGLEVATTLGIFPDGWNDETERNVRAALANGSVHVPGYDRPEGAVIYYPKDRTRRKLILDKWE